MTPLEIRVYCPFKDKTLFISTCVEKHCTRLLSWPFDLLLKQTLLFALFLMKWNQLNNYNTSLRLLKIAQIRLQQLEAFHKGRPQSGGEGCLSDFAQW